MITFEFYLTDSGHYDRRPDFGLYDKPEEVYNVCCSLTDSGELHIVAYHRQGKLDTHAVTAEAVNRAARYIHEKHPDRAIVQTRLAIHTFSRPA